MLHVQYLRSSQLRSLQPMSLWYSSDSTAVNFFTYSYCTETYETRIYARSRLHTQDGETKHRFDRYRSQLMCACDSLVVKQGSSYNFPDRLLCIRVRLIEL